MSKNLQVFYVFFSSLLLALAIPNEIYLQGNPFIALTALIPFYYVYTTFSSYLNAMLLTGLFTTLTHLFSSYWLAFFKDFALFTLGASALGTGFIGMAIGAFLYSPYAKYKKHNTLRIYSSPKYSFFLPCRVLWFCAIYTLYEWIKSTGWFGYPWGVVSMCMYSWKCFIQIASITGTYGVTFLVIFFSAIVVEGMKLYYLSKIRMLDTKYYKIKKLNFRAKLLNKTLLIPSLSSYKSISAIWLSFFILSFIYGIYQYTKPTPPVKYLNTIMVQQNSNPWDNADDEETILLSEKLTTEALEKAKQEDKTVDLIVWSEGCLRRSFPLALDYYDTYPEESPLFNFIKDCSIPFLLGGSYVLSSSPRRAMNAALLFDKAGQFAGVYGKNHLVPCAEVLPFSDIPAINSFWKKTLGISAGWAPGSLYTYFDIPSHKDERVKHRAKTYYLNNKGIYEGVETATDAPIALDAVTKNIRADFNNEYKKLKVNTLIGEDKERVRFSAPICFDDAFPDVCRPFMKYGSEVFMNITDDSWSLTRSSEYQHLIVSTFRAIEYRTTLARSTNSGVSCVIDNKGNIIQSMPLFKETAAFFSIPIYAPSTTIYYKLGNWIPALIILIVLIVELYTLFTHKTPCEVKSERVLKKRKEHKNKVKISKNKEKKQDFSVFNPQNIIKHFPVSATSTIAKKERKVVKTLDKTSKIKKTKKSIDKIKDKDKTK